ncbi:MAG: HAMP domain-containing protein [bacterium]|nr:HAMP domain-containing protein [bacterium]
MRNNQLKKRFTEIFKKLFQKRKKLISEEGYQDALFLVGIFVFSAVLIIGLFPSTGTEIVIGKDFFVYAIMAVPVIAALYFIIITFRQNIYTGSSQFDNSIRKKMALAFVFVAILPTLLIVLASNNFIYRTFSKLIPSKTSKALQEAISMSNEVAYGVEYDISREIKSLKFQFDREILSPVLKKDRDNIREMYRLKGYSLIIYRVQKDRLPDTRLKILDLFDRDSNEFEMFYGSVGLTKRYRVDRINLKGRDIVAGCLQQNEFLIVLYQYMSGLSKRRVDLFNSSLEDYEKFEYSKTYFISEVGVFLLVLSIGVILISVLISLYLSKNITKPVLELANAAGNIASGNLSIDLKRESEDELGFLFSSFNQMVRELESNRKLMYQKQRLEAWREMARRLVHEIKNPLTPIRLSAERMRQRFMENNPYIEKIILYGTETIIEEVDVLMDILSEFTVFARLPEMKPEKTDINPLLENCAYFLVGRENIRFDVEKDERIPPVYLDKILMRQALVNLIQNAIDAIDASGHDGVISIASELIDDEEQLFYRIRISDNGIGISEEDLNNIFEPGFSKKKSGTGLGLAIVEKIILEHRGVIHCQSEKGSGTEFIIGLPINKDEIYNHG